MAKLVVYNLALTDFELRALSFVSLQLVHLIVSRDDALNLSIHHECEGGIEKSVLRITHWHHEACRLMTYVDCEDGLFYTILTQIMIRFLAHY